MALAAQKATEDPPEALKYKTWVMRVSIHCEGCKKKVKKILSHVQGVYGVEIDIKQQKVIVTGNVEADTLIKKLTKSGKNAELWPQPPPTQKEKKPGKIKNEEKNVAVERERHEESAREVELLQPKNGDVIINKEDKPPANSEASSGGSAKIGKDRENNDNGDAVKESEAKAKEGKNGGRGGGEAGGNRVKDGSKVSGREGTSEQKKPETGSAGGQPPVEAEEKNAEVENNGGGGGGVEKSASAGNGESDANGKRKKKKGHKGNYNADVEISSDAAPASTGDDAGPRHILKPANDGPPRYHYYPTHGPPHYYAPPPVCGVSYNASHPTNTYAASYYAPTPPNSYVYAYPGPEVQPPPSDVDSYPRQPLDSFEIFSDENPNGCKII